MTPALRAVYDELLERAALGRLAPRASEWRAHFAARTGIFPDDHPHAGARVAAAWEDALVTGGIAHALLSGFDDEAERGLIEVLAGGQRGVFRLRVSPSSTLVDETWRGGSFLLLAGDDFARGAAEGVPLGSAFVGRVVAASDGCALLPGVVWLPEAASPFLDGLLDVARREGIDADGFADALLRMDHALLTLSRVRAEYAFRPEALRATLRRRA